MENQARNTDEIEIDVLEVLYNLKKKLDEKRGKFIFYELNMTVMDEVVSWAASFRRKE